MINRRDPVLYLASLNDSPPGACLQVLNEWLTQVRGMLTNPAVDDGLEIVMTEFKAELEGAIADVEAPRTCAFVDNQKVKAQEAIDDA